MSKKRMTKREDKVALQVLIPRELYNRVLEVAVRVYGVQRGAMSLAVEEALAYWLQMHTQTHTPYNPRLTTREVFDRVLMALRDYLGYMPLKVRRENLVVAIKRARQIRDERSVKRWIQAFCDEGLLKPMGCSNPKYATAFEIIPLKASPY